MTKLLKYGRVVPLRDTQDYKMSKMPAIGVEGYTKPEYNDEQYRNEEWLKAKCWGVNWHSDYIAIDCDDYANGSQKQSGADTIQRLIDIKGLKCIKFETNNGTQFVFKNDINMEQGQNLVNLYGIKLDTRTNQGYSAIKITSKDRTQGMIIPDELSNVSELGSLIDFSKKYEETGLWDSGNRFEFCNKVRRNFVQKYGSYNAFEGYGVKKVKDYMLLNPKYALDNEYNKGHKFSQKEFEDVFKLVRQKSSFNDSEEKENANDIALALIKEFITTFNVKRDKDSTGNSIYWEIDGVVKLMVPQDDFIRWYEEKNGIPVFSTGTQTSNLLQALYLRVPLVSLKDSESRRLIRFTNGIYNTITREFTTDTSKAAQFSLPFDFDREYRHPYMNNFVNALNSKWGISITRAFFAQAAHLYYDKKFAVILWGDTKQGKSSIYNYVAKCLTFNNVISLENLSSSNTLSGICQYNCIGADETDQDKEICNKNLKVIISNQSVETEQKYKDRINERFGGVCFWASNKLPAFKGMTAKDGLITRCFVYRWKSLNEEMLKTIPWCTSNHNPEPEEVKAFWMFCIRSYEFLNKDGLFDYQALITHHPKNDIIQCNNKSNHIEAFFAEEYYNKDREIKWTEVTYQNYLTWCMENGVTRTKVAKYILKTEFELRLPSTTTSDFYDDLLSDLD